MNTIIVDNGTFSKLYSTEYYHYVDNFIFDEFALVIADEDGKKNYAPIIVHLIKGTHVFIFQFPYWSGNQKKYVPVKVDGDNSLYQKQAQIDFARHFGNEKKAEKALTIWSYLIRSFVYYLMNYTRNQKEVHPVQRKYSREHRLSTKQNKIYLFDDIIKYIHDNYVSKGGHHNIQCPCWEVRGHYRRYKSGKVVFIKSFKKGKKRNEEEPKSKNYYT